MYTEKSEPHQSYSQTVYIMTVAYYSKAGCSSPTLKLTKSCTQGNATTRHTVKTGEIIRNLHYQSNSLLPMRLRVHTELYKNQYAPRS